MLFTHDNSIMPHTPRKLYKKGKGPSSLPWLTQSYLPAIAVCLAMLYFCPLRFVKGMTSLSF